MRSFAKAINIKKKPANGSITIEAAVVMPVFICVVISIVYFVKVVHINELVRRAAWETAEELAAVSYLVHKSGIEDGLHEWLVEGFGKAINEKNTGSEEKPDKIFESIKNAVIEKGAQDAKNSIMIPVARLLAARHLSDPMDGEGDYLERLGIRNGLEGLDFGGCSFCSNGTEDIEIVIRYTVRIPVPFRILGDLHFEQSACARAWLCGDNPSPEQEDIWSLDNLTRGRRIREIFGANLPWGFPGISSFKNGCAELIRSMDTTAATYQDFDNVERTANGYINELANYKGQPVPWGKDKIVIPPDGIRTRKLILVIPGNQLPEGMAAALGRCKIYAIERGVVLDIRKYGYSYANLEKDASVEA